MDNRKIENIARVCHEANRAWCQVHEDTTQKSWDLADQWQRDSAIKGVEFALANPLATCSAQHEAWSADKIKDGWVYGLTKDAKLKTHPCLVPFNKLPVMQQAKDKLFVAIVTALS